MFDGIEFVTVDDREQIVELMKRVHGLLTGDGVKRQRIRDLVEVDDLDFSVRIDDDIRQKIGEDIGIVFFIICMGDDIAVPVKERIVRIVELADLEAVL